MTRALPICAALLWALPAAATTDSEIASLLNEFLVAVDDPAMHDRFWADDLVYVSAAGVVRTKADILKSMRAGDTPGTRGRKADEAKSTFSAEDVKVRPLAADVAVLNFRLVQHAEGRTNHFRNSGTFVRRNGRWQAVSWQATREDNDGAPGAAPDANLRAQIEPLVHRIWDAYRAGDIAAHNALLTGDYTSIHPDGSVHPRPTREQILAQPLGTFSLSDFSATQVREGAALVYYLADVRGPPSNPVRVRYRVGELWVQGDGHWKCRSYQPTVLPAP